MFLAMIGSFYLAPRAGARADCDLAFTHTYSQSR